MTGIIGVYITIIFISFCIGYALGYKKGDEDGQIEFLEKKEYYEWLLEMKKRQDFEEVKFKEKPKKMKKEKYCDICGDQIKSGTRCDSCKAYYR